MDTPTLAAYYREPDPMKRKTLLEQSIEAGEEPEANEIRQELWKLRYHVENGTMADGFLKFWMTLEFNRNAGNKWFGGAKSARKEIQQELDRIKFKELMEKSELHRELYYRELCHLVRLYIELCEKDRSYNSILCGIMTMNKDKAKTKLQADVYETAISLPEQVGMKEELAPLIRAAREMYELHYPGEGGLPE